VSEMTWPHARGARSGLIAQFGTERADLAAWALTTGDPLADAVVSDMHDRHPQARQAVQLGIRNGLDSLVDPPDSVAAFLIDTERLPDYADDDLLDRGSAPFFTMPPAVHLISLSAGALIRVYESPSIAAVLTSTGRLVDGADRRIRETGKWVATAMLPGSLRAGQPGYEATLQVRLLHANMRRLVRSRGYDERAYGTPINQVDLARTWMDFTVTSLQAEASMGFGLTTSETTTLYRYWWLVGHLLGIDARLIEGISSNEQARRVDELLQALTGPLIPDSATLAAATLDSITGELHDALKLPESIASKALSALARRFHGHAIADELGIETSSTADAILSRAISVIRSHRLKERRDLEHWQRNQQKYLAESRARLSDAHDAQYESVEVRT
jgi:ER-bound oxygenase mpaB/B'/Rubber oxygenase, catalytic domain